MIPVVGEIIFGFARDEGANRNTRPECKVVQHEAAFPKFLIERTLDQPPRCIAIRQAELVAVTPAQ
jgi:hypothetical protein